jgi:hypothetical protein
LGRLSAAAFADDVFKRLGGETPAGWIGGREVDEHAGYSLDRGLEVRMLRWDAVVYHDISRGLPFIAPRKGDIFGPFEVSGGLGAAWGRLLGLGLLSRLSLP